MAKNDYNLRKGDDQQNCGLCKNYNPMDGACAFLKKDVTASQVCDGFAPLEASEDAIMSQLFGG
jgi:hypothetical protein